MQVNLIWGKRYSRNFHARLCWVAITLFFWLAVASTWNFATPFARRLEPRIKFIKKFYLYLLNLRKSMDTCKTQQHDRERKIRIRLARARSFLNQPNPKGSMLSEIQDAMRQTNMADEVEKPFFSHFGRWLHHMEYMLPCFIAMPIFKL